MGNPDGARELLELAAKAEGWKGWRSKHGYWNVTRPDGTTTTCCVGWAGAYEPTFADALLECNWDPRQDDGDALRLAVKLHITPMWKWYVDRAVCEAWSYHLDDSHGRISVEEPLGDDECKATRVAIFRVAAEIGRRMP